MKGGENVAEEWRKIENWEGLYEVSNLGNVKSVRTAKLLKPSIKRGYYQVMFSYKCSLATYSIHRLVAQSFLSTYDENLVVHHINGNKLDNRLDNLVCITKALNTQQAYNDGFIKTKAVKAVIDGRLVIFSSAAEAARKLKMPYSTVKNICRGIRTSSIELSYLEVN